MHEELELPESNNLISTLWKVSPSLPHAGNLDRNASLGHSN